MVGWRVSDGAKKMITVTEYKDDKLGLILGFQDDESMLLNMQGRSYVVGEYDGAFT